MGTFSAVIGLLANLFLVWLIFKEFDYIIRVMEKQDRRRLQKCRNSLMAAIAIMMIRIGAGPR